MSNIPNPPGWTPTPGSPPPPPPPPPPPRPAAAPPAPPSGASPSSAPSAPPAGSALRILAAIAIVVGGLVHLQLYFDGYRDFPNDNLGRSFLANAVGSMIVAAALVARRDVLVRLAGIGVSAGTLVAFAISRSDSGIFGFTETGLNPSPQAIITLITEIGAIVLLAATFVPAIGAGKNTEIKLAAPLVGLIAVGAIVGGVMWAKSPEGSKNQEGGDDTEEPSGDGTAVDIADFAFNPNPVTVPVGTTITWTNDDSFRHTVTNTDGEFSSDEMVGGSTFEFTFDTPGTFSYICAIHPSMTGEVIVE